ncbi:hypothetical protein JCM33374_g2236 [Metschnikowia sp. JCM 33374]|nr:hypothetical protein JCM33374_g2236 [Metschnikowia sp. JCM 33374]
MRIVSLKKNLEYNLSGVHIKAPLSDLILTNDAGTKYFKSQDGWSNWEQLKHGISYWCLVHLALSDDNTQDIS